MSTQLIHKYSRFAVLGASGKMGRGIVLLMAQFIVDSNLKDAKERVLFAIDVHEEGLNNLLKYIEAKAYRIAEKKLSSIRELFKDQNNDEDIIHAYVNKLLSVIKSSTSISSAYNAEIIFEAVVEKIDVKSSLFKDIDKHSVIEPFYLTNTSSIPINLIENAAEIEGRIIGFHFYNPPPVQRLLEIIKSDSTCYELISLADELSAKLRKTVIYAPDKPGFIGNGQFIREVSFACSLTNKLSKEYGLGTSLFIVNEISRELLLRPMGIFEVVDYVGVNVCDFIMGVMSKAFTYEIFDDMLLKHWIEQEVIGGQDTNGQVKDGVFKYDKGKIIGVIGELDYESVPELEYDGLNTYSWKNLKLSENLRYDLNNYFNSLSKSQNALAQIAIQYGRSCREIGEYLVDNEIAYSDDDVNKVMTLGFHHLYGPVNHYFDEH